MEGSGCGERGLLGGGLRKGECDNGSEEVLKGFRKCKLQINGSISRRSVDRYKEKGETSLKSPVEVEREGLL